MVKKLEKGLYLKPIASGTAIDHLPPGSALKVLKIVGMGEDAVTVAIRVPSHKMGVKDLVFVENKFLSGEEISKVALVAKDATVNLIKDNEVYEKVKLSLPDKAEGILECINPKCITNTEKDIQTVFGISRGPIEAKCHYCEKTMNEEEIATRIKG